MKKILIGILTIFLTLAVIMLGVSINTKATIVDTIDTIVKKEVTNTIVDYIEDNTDYNKDEIQKSIDKAINENAAIKNITSEYFDKVIDVINGKDVNINVSKEIENIIDSSEAILKDNNITITEETKKELLEIVSSEELNNTFNNEIKEFKNDIPSELKIALDIFSFITSSTFKIILIISIIILLVLIALLKKSTYKWLTNLGATCLISGIVFCGLMPSLINMISRELEGINISTSSISLYGFINIGLGIIAFILNIVLTKYFANKTSNAKKEDNEKIDN